MKTIQYFIIAGLICLTLAFSGKDIAKKIILQPVSTEATREDISRSGKIITRRLELYGIKASVSVNEDSRQIVVQVPDNIDVPEITGLLTAKGEMGFYEMLTLNNSSPKLACAGAPDRTKEERMRDSLKSANVSPEYELIWSKVNKESAVCLYAIKVNPRNGEFIRKDGIGSVRSVNKYPEGITIMINFKPDFARTWSMITKNSIGKPVAIVIDSTVFYSPVVRDVMDQGLCEITGNFTQKEASYFLSLANTDILPVSFVIK